MNNEKNSRKKNVVATLVVMGLTLVSRLLGFLRIAAISAVFGGSGQADVINLAFSIPNNLRKLLAEGAFTAAFIPTLAKIDSSDPRHSKTQRLQFIRDLFTLQILILVPLVALLMIFATPLIRYVLSEFEQSQKIADSAALLRLFMPYLLLIAIAALMMGTLEYSSHFYIAAITPLLFSLAVIPAIIFLAPNIGIYAMAAGVLAGGALQIAVMAPVFSRLGYRLTLRKTFCKNPRLKQAAKNWLPIVATSSVFTITSTIAFRFASGLHEGSASSLNYALVFWQLPFGVLTASVTRVLFPRLSREAAANDSAAMNRTVSHGLTMLFCLLLPVSIIFFFFADEIIVLTLRRQAFTLANGRLTASVLRYYSAGLFSVSCFTFIQRFCYARRSFRRPFTVAMIIAAVDIVLSLYLKESRLKVNGIALANSISFTIGAALLIAISCRDVIKDHGRKLIMSSSKVVAAAAVLALYLAIIKLYFPIPLRQGADIAQFMLLAAQIAGGLVIVIVFYIMFRLEIVNILFTKKKM